MQIGVNMRNGVLQKDNFKIVYVAPMKALAAEMTATFGKRLAALGNQLFLGLLSNFQQSTYPHAVSPAVLQSHSKIINDAGRNHSSGLTNRGYSVCGQFRMPYFHLEDLLQA